MNGIWVRSQNKMMLVFAKAFLVLENKFIHKSAEWEVTIQAYVSGEEEGFCIGAYSKERALQVLDEIQQFIIDYHKCKDNVMFLPVFEMPQE